MADQFSVTVEELTALMQYRGKEALEQLIKKFGDGDSLCRALKTSPTDGDSHMSIE